MTQETYTYNAHTNMISYNRTGASSASRTMNYAGNRMTSVETPGAGGGGGAIRYDTIGRIVSSDIEGMTEVKYNVVGYPSYIAQADGGYVHNTYTAGGARMASRRTDAAGVVTLMEYEGNEVIENGKLRMLLFDGGYVDFSGNAPRYCWYTKDHLGSVRAVADADGNVFATYAYRPYGEEFAAMTPAAPVTTNSTSQNSQSAPVSHGGGHLKDNEPLYPTVTYSPAEGSDWQPFKFSGKESLTRVGLDLYDFGARMYSPSAMRWMTMDPLCEKFYDISPYVYCAGNPVNLVDPDGKDPIFARGFWGKVKQIGDDGKNDSKAYLVRGDVAREVRRATKNGENYSGDLSQSNNVMLVPTGEKMAGVEESLRDTKQSEKENGGHSNVGDNFVTRWDEGTAATSYMDENGNLVAKASMQMFMIGGKSAMPTDASSVEMWWHVHPDTSINGVPLGDSKPSPADINGQKKMVKRGYTGNSFVVGARSNTVTYFNQNGPLITITWKDFLKMGGR